MRLELAERLRCPAAHTPTPLIVVAERTVDRELTTALLGCPVCRLEARIVAGDVRFDAPPVKRPDSADRATNPHAHPSAVPAPDLERVVALLGLSEPGGAVLLTGRYATLARSLSAHSEVSVVVMHAATDTAFVDGASAVEGSAVATVHGSPSSVPFTDGTFRGVALDAGLPASFSADAVRTTAIGGRVLAAAAVPAPTGLKELARDDSEWVAARESSGTIVELKRRV